MAQDLNESYELFDDAFIVSGNLAEKRSYYASALPEEEPVEIQEPVVPEAPQKPRKRAVPRLQMLPRVAFPRRMQILAILCVLAIGVSLLTVATASNRLYTAEQKLEDAQTALEKEKNNTAILRDSIRDSITWADLYEYATGDLGMREATGGEVIMLDPLTETYSLQTGDQIERTPTEVRIHMFGK